MRCESVIESSRLLSSDVADIGRPVFGIFVSYLQSQPLVRQADRATDRKELYTARPVTAGLRSPLVDCSPEPSVMIIRQ